MFGVLAQAYLSNKRVPLFLPYPRNYEDALAWVTLCFLTYTELTALVTVGEESGKND